MLTLSLVNLSYTFNSHIFKFYLFLASFQLYQCTCKPIGIPQGLSPFYIFIYGIIQFGPKTGVAPM